VRDREQISTYSYPSYMQLAGLQGKQFPGKKSGSRKVGSATVVQKCDEIVCLEALAALREQSSEWFHDK